MPDTQRLSHFIAMRWFGNVTHKVSHWAIANTFCLLRVIMHAGGSTPSPFLLLTNTKASRFLLLSLRYSLSMKMNGTLK